MNSPNSPNINMNMNNTVYSVNDPSSSYNPQAQSRQSGTMGQFSNVKTNKSFVDNKPMIQGLVRSVLKVQKGGEAHLINTGLTDIDGAKQIAHNLFGFYDRDQNGSIDTVKFNPQKEDVNSFFGTLDVDGNSKVTIDDMENLCIRYLTGSTLGVPYKFTQKRSQQFGGTQVHQMRAPSAAQRY